MTVIEDNQACIALKNETFTNNALECDAVLIDSPSEDYLVRAPV